MSQARSALPTVTEALKRIKRLIDTNYSGTSEAVQTAINQLIVILRKQEKQIFSTSTVELRKIEALTYQEISDMRYAYLRQEMNRVEMRQMRDFYKILSAILSRYEELHPASKAALDAMQARKKYQKSGYSDAKAAMAPALEWSADKESQEALEKKRDDKSPVALIEDEEVDLTPSEEILAFSENSLTFKEGLISPCIGSFWTPPRKKAAVIVLGGIAATAFANELILTACDLAAGADVWQRFADSAAYGEDFVATYGKTIPDFMKNSPTEIPNFSYFLIGAALLAIAIVKYKLDNNQLQAKKMVEETEEAQHSLYGSGCYYIDKV